MEKGHFLVARVMDFKVDLFPSHPKSLLYSPFVIVGDGHY
jgi:hypothetical protein